MTWFSTNKRQARRLTRRVNKLKNILRKLPQQYDWQSQISRYTHIPSNTSSLRSRALHFFKTSGPRIAQQVQAQGSRLRSHPALTGTAVALLGTAAYYFKPKSGTK